jgi:ammonium transporter, Amt family
MVCLLSVHSSSYSMCYGDDVGRFIGNPKSYYMFSDTYGRAATEQVGGSTIPSSVFAVYELGFPLLTAGILACSLEGTVNEVH